MFNAENFVDQALNSVVNQKHVDEIILINDRSMDNTLQKAQCWKERDTRISIINSEINVGAGESRNIGIRAAKNNWIAFLDVDDHYYPNRFLGSVNIISENTDCDGVYCAVKNTFESKEAYMKFLATRPKFIRENKEDPRHTLFTLYEQIEPRNLFKALMKGDKGFFHFNGLLVKKNLLIKVGLLDAELKLNQDIDLIYKLSLIGNLYADDVLIPVAGRHVHSSNRVYGNDDKLRFYRLKSIQGLKKFAKHHNCSKENQALIEEKTIKMVARELLNWNIYKYYRIKYLLLKFTLPLILTQYFKNNSITS